MRVSPPDDFLVVKRKTRKHSYSDSGVPLPLLEREARAGSLSKKPFTVTVTDTSARPSASMTASESQSTTTASEGDEFWRYFQNSSQLAFVVPGGGDAVIGRNEARQLLANFRGTNVESISKTDSGLMHICGLSIRQLHAFMTGLSQQGTDGMSVIRDLSIGRAKGRTKTLLLQIQRERIDAHIRMHSTSAVYESDFAEVGADYDTVEDMPSPVVEAQDQCHVEMRTRISLLDDFDFESELKMDRPSAKLVESAFTCPSGLGRRRTSSCEQDTSGEGTSAETESYSLMVPMAVGRWDHRHLRTISTSLTVWEVEEEYELELGEDSDYDSDGDGLALTESMEAASDEPPDDYRDYSRPHIHSASTSLTSPPSAETVTSTVTVEEDDDDDDHGDDVKKDDVIDDVKDDVKDDMHPIFFGKVDGAPPGLDLKSRPTQTFIELNEMSESSGTMSTPRCTTSTPKSTTAATSDSEELIFLESEAYLAVDSRCNSRSRSKRSVSLSISLSDRLATMMHAPVGV